MRLFRKIEDGVELRLDHGTLVTAVVALGVCASLIFLMGLMVGRMIWAGQPKVAIAGQPAEAGREPPKSVDMTFYEESAKKGTKIEPPPEFVAKWEEKKAAEAAAEAAIAAAKSEAAKALEEAEAKEKEEVEGGDKATVGEKALAPKVAKTEQKPAASPSGGKFTVQLNSFKDRSLAERMAKSLAEHGVRAEIVKTSAGYKVLSGSFASREEAQGFRDSLSKKGIKGVVSPR